MKTLEKNELLANFLGWTKQDNMWIRWYGEWFDDHGNRRTDKTREVLLFDSDWNWLMAVVEKIESIKPKGNTSVRFMVKIKGTNCQILDMFDNQTDFLNLYLNYRETKMEATYEAVVKFIEWYNNQII